MTPDDIEAGLQKAMVFFDRAQQVADTDNFDYAIEMYIEGLRKAPESLESGHIPLRKISLIRQGKGGKKPNFKEKMKFSGGKTPLDKMLNAETLLAKDPDNLSHAEAMLRAAVAGGCTRTAQWIAQLIFDANIASDRPSITTYLLLKDSYKELQLFDMAVKACKYALQLRPEDSALQDELRDLSAQLTMQKGRYGQEVKFTDSIRDKKSQEKLYSSKKLIDTDNFRQQALEEAKKEVIKNPNSPASVLKLAQTLFDMNTRTSCEQAVKVLRDAYSRSRDFNFKKKEGEFILKRLSLEARQTKKQLDADPDNPQLKRNYQIAQNKVNKAQMQHYKAMVAQYPTDYAMKYDLAMCYLKEKKYDEAIPLLQSAQKDPRKKNLAMNQTGLCFFLKGWYADAIDIFNQALDACEVKDSETAKEIRYNLARSYEEDGNHENALDMYRKLAQLDYGFKDVRDRVDNLRNAVK